MNTLNNAIVFLLNAVEQNSLLSIICSTTGILRPLVDYQSISRFLNGENRFCFSDLIIPLSFYNLSKYFPIEKHNNIGPDNTIFLNGKNKFINLGECFGTLP